MPEQILARLRHLHPAEIDLDLSRVLRLLSALSDPHKKLPPVVHVAGTNGKGSVVAFLRAILEAAGYRVHVYTSPHLVRFNERIRLAGSPIDDASLQDVLTRIEKANDGQPITFFEATTAAAFLAFSETPADIVILETGLGGRLDATNVVERPALTVLTPIAMDHMEYLGDTLAAIAAEKAAIMKYGVGCVLAKQERATMKVLEARSLSFGVPLWLEGRDWFLRTHPEGVVFQGKSGTIGPMAAPALQGIFQLHNAGLALAAAERLEGFDIPASAMALGLKTVEWPARLQPLAQGKLASLLPAGWELWLDGGHNSHAAKAIALQAREWKDRPLLMIFGMLKRKDAKGYLKPLAARAERLIAVPIEGEDFIAPDDIVMIAKGEGLLYAEAGEGIEAALAKLASYGGPPARVLICGSLYLAGEVLRKNGTSTCQMEKGSHDSSP
ncbi:MAG: bifunctional folylpolyglutamate synthase/dihydrofolate synthase [Alphaproteobacteria bacterium]|nr:bifunctional folylpolyglutamate synthase/dihydrofolate synthase [Alphaproteobacteria bacterium]